MMIIGVIEFLQEFFLNFSFASPIPLPCDPHGVDQALIKNIFSRSIPCSDDGTPIASTLSVFGPGGLLSRDGGILLLVNVIIGAIAILFLGVIASQLIFANGDSEKITQARQQIQWLALGLLMVSGAEILIYQVLSPEVNFLTDSGAAVAYQGLMLRVLGLMKFIAGGLVLITLLRAAYAMITVGDKEETQNKGKTYLKSALYGSILVVLAEGGILLLAMPDLTVNASGAEVNTVSEQAIKIAIRQIGGMIRFVLSFVGAIAVAILIYASVLYATNFGNEETQKKATGLIVRAVLGIIMAISSFAIINVVMP